MKIHPRNFVPLALTLAVLVFNSSFFQPAQAASWSTNGPMTTARSGHAAIVLNNGKVLLAGGSGSDAELYDPATGTCTSTGSMKVTHGGSTVTMLPNGKVLVVGGNDNSSVNDTPAT